MFNLPSKNISTSPRPIKKTSLKGRRAEEVTRTTPRPRRRPWRGCLQLCLGDVAAGVTWPRRGAHVRRALASLNAVLMEPDRPEWLLILTLSAGFRLGVSPVTRSFIFYEQKCQIYLARTPYAILNSFVLEGSSRRVVLPSEVWSLSLSSPSLPAVLGGKSSPQEPKRSHMGRAGVRTQPRSKAHCINYFSVTPSAKCLSHVGLLNKQMFVTTLRY